MSDPLKGMRRKIANGEVKVLRWPAEHPCPVENGDRFKVQGIEIEIHSVNRHIAPGKPVEWHATFVRHEKDRVYLLRQGVTATTPRAGCRQFQTSPSQWARTGKTKWPKSGALGTRSSGARLSESVPKTCCTESSARF